MTIAVDDGVKSVYLHGGQVLVTAERCVITTIVVSSVAVGVWDAHNGVGGMNHYMLPSAVGGQSGGTPRYASVAMNSLMEKMFAAGAQRHFMRAKIFGGARHSHSEINDTIRELAFRNIDIARESLAAAGIPVLEERLGGTSGRRITFRTDDGWSEVTEMPR